MSKVPQIGSMQYFCNISRKNLVFSILHANKHKSLLQIDTIILVSLTRNAESIRESFQYLRDIYLSEKS